MTTRIDHTGHNHPKTTAARTACRKALKAAPIATYATCAVGKGKQDHVAVLDADGNLIAAKCGAGYGRGVRKNSPLRRLADLPVGHVVGCHRCR